MASSSSSSSSSASASGMVGVMDGMLPGPDGVWPPEIIAKAQKMSGKTEEVRQTFNLPSTECVVQVTNLEHKLTPTRSNR